MNTAHLKRSLAAAVLTAAATAALATPALAAAPEEPTTEPVGALTGTTAVLKGQPNPHTEAELRFHFLYSTTAQCSEGTATASEPEANRKAASKVTTTATGLEALTTYTYCIVATNPEGETTGTVSQQSFKTPASAAVVEGETAGGASPFEQTLEATVNPENQTVASCVFQYGTTETYGQTQPCNPPALEGNTPQPATATITGLAANTTYHYRVDVRNLTGETKSTDATLTTAVAQGPFIANYEALFGFYFTPQVLGVAGLTATTATLQAVILTYYQDTTCSLLYWPEGETQTEAQTVGCDPAELAATGEGLFPTAAVASLTPQTTYHFRFTATNATGTTESEPEQFTTFAAPTPTVAPAQDVARGSALLSGTINPGGQATSYHYTYVPQAEYEPAATECPEHHACAFENGQITPTVLDAVEIHGGEIRGHSYTTASASPATVTGLQPETTYEYALVATNSEGTTVTPAQTFTTGGKTPPVVSTGEAEGVTQTSAELTGSADTRELPTTGAFELTTAPTAAGAGPTTPATGAALTGTTDAFTLTYPGVLAPGTTYYYRALATGPDGTEYGAERTFTTASFPATLSTEALTPLLPARSIAELDAAEAQEAKHLPPATLPLTSAQKLKAALKQCRRKHSRHRRTVCERQAHHRYPTPKRK